MQQVSERIDLEFLLIAIAQPHRVAHFYVISLTRQPIACGESFRSKNSRHTSLVASSLP